jgi:hypothetical protein
MGNGKMGKGETGIHRQAEQSTISLVQSTRY